MTPPVGSRTGLYVDASATLRTKNGLPVVLRGLEFFGVGASNPEIYCQQAKDIGCNAVSPLLPSKSAPALKAAILAARSRGLVLCANFDHTGNSRASATDPAVVAELNAADNVILECEVELGDGMTQSAWTTYAKTFIDDMAHAGIKCPVKVGTEQGGRAPKFVLAAGAELVAYAKDKLPGGLMFTWQAYWKAATGGWHYSQDNGFPSQGTAGALECCAALRSSGLCFLVGLDATDNVGLTPYREIATALEAAGISWQYWCGPGAGDSFGNDIDKQLPVKALFLAQPHPISAF